jgi:phosphatidylinositol-3-phosphatase
MWVETGIGPIRSGENTFIVANESTSMAPSKVMVLMDENANWSQYVNGQGPYMYGLAKKYGFCSNYHGFFNPSLPNYMILTSGSNCGFTTDVAPPSGHYKTNRSIFDNLIAAKLSWNAFAQDIPGPCPVKVSSAGVSPNIYVARHVPALYYKSIATGAGCANIVDITKLNVNALPSYCMITPNLLNDGHTPASVPNTDKFNSTFLPPVLASTDFTSGTLAIFVVTDNGSPFSTASPCIVLWAGMKAPTVVSAKRTHYDTLHQIEKILGLPFLTSNDKNAVGLPEFFV